MEFSDVQPSPWYFFFNSRLLFPSYLTQDNYVHWTETPESHIYLANIPGVRKEEIKVEVEDSIYLIIKTQVVDGEAEAARSFMRKFRLRAMIDISGIAAHYEDGVLRATVPRSSVNGRIRIDPANLPERYEILAPAA